MNKICVYTCITGNYDTLKKLDYPDKNFDYICFTNNKSITSDFWKMVYISEDLDNLTLARKIKILGHDVLKKYDVTIWLDGAMQLRKPLSKFIKDCCDLEQYDMVGFKHRERDCIYDEMDACVYYFKESEENVSKLTSFLEKEKYPRHNGLIESTVLVRKNNSDISKLMELWYEILSKYTRRDQLSFNYCLWKRPVKIQMLEMNVFDNDYLVHHGHNSISFSKKYRVYFDKEYKSSNLIENTYDINKEYYIASFKVPVTCKEFELIVSPFDCTMVEEIKTNYDYDVNCWTVSGKRFFKKNSNITFKGSFKKGSNIRILLKITPVDIDKVLYMYDCDVINYNEKIHQINKEKEKIHKEFDNVINSKGWRFLEKLRKIKRFGK